MIPNWYQMTPDMSLRVAVLLFLSLRSIVTLYELSLDMECSVCPLGDLAGKSCMLQPTINFLNNLEAWRFYTKNDSGINF